ncbi:stage III sporulation protein AF [Clostridium sp. MB40-C1]|uniref:stage III sporulation protein AF n=1 Tax=Clostridium sp. MB40-C1 TaxID=3070996 RepID=UPI0027E0C845|nr:stage III sporulation protein AF [Clostridium sp. MB40-C1]WMJ81857.1 stage III sporulation protein AF [Clostridium sp. MB40-C1]
MLQHIKVWIINICTAVFFITAVEMILPNNKMKKYAKFVLGLILVTVIMNPIIKIFDKNFNMDSYVDTACEYFESNNHKKDYDKYKTSNIDNTANVFSKNLEKICLDKLKERFPKDNYEVLIDVSFNKEKENFVIDLVNVGFTDKKIKKIKKIKIGDTESSEKSEISNSKKCNDIKDYLSVALNIPKNKIKVHTI